MNEWNVRKLQNTCLSEYRSQVPLCMHNVAVSNLCPHVDFPDSIALMPLHLRPVATTGRTFMLYYLFSSFGRDITTHRPVTTRFVEVPMRPNDPYRGRTAPLISKRCILYIYSTNIGTEYFKRGIYSPFFPLQNAVCFITLTYLVPILFTFCIQVVLKLKK